MRRGEKVNRRQHIEFIIFVRERWRKRVSYHSLWFGFVRAVRRPNVNLVLASKDEILKNSNATTARNPRKGDSVGADDRCWNSTHSP